VAIEVSDCHLISVIYVASWRTLEEVEVEVECPDLRQYAV
jgi:hypothetical protein